MSTAAVTAGGATFVSVQNEYSLFHRKPEQDGVLAECERKGLAFLPFFPLASGLLSGKYRLGAPVPAGTRLSEERYAGRRSEENLQKVEALIRFAEAQGHTLLELAISWLAFKPVITSVIAGATKPEQIRANAAAADWKLTPADLEEIDRIMAEPGV